MKLDKTTFIITGRSQQLCPQMLSNVIFDFIEKFKWIFFLVGIIVGPLELTVGGKIFGITVFLLSFLLCGGILIVIADVFLFTQDSSAYWAYFVLFCCLVVAIVVALLLVKLTKLGIIVCGAAGGFFCCMMMNYLVFWRIEAQPSWIFFYNMLIVFTILGSILAYEFNNHIIIVSTSFIGSYITIRSISLIFGGFPNEFQLNMNINTQTLVNFPWQFYIYFAAIIGLFIFGMSFQFKRRNESLESIIQNEKMVNLIEKANKNIENNKLKFPSKK